MNQRQHLTLGLVLGTFLTILMGGAPASAHDFSTSYSRIEVNGSQVDIMLTLSLLDLHTGPVLDVDQDGLVSTDEFEQGLVVLFDAIRENYHVRDPDAPLESVVAGYEFVAENVARIDIAYTFDGDVNDLTIVSTLDRLTQADHRHLLQIGEGDQARHAVLDRNDTEVVIDHATGIPLWVTTLDFMNLGIEHIFTGYDHLALLLGLLLATSTLLSLAKVVTSFTVAHSVTLALATFGVVSLPGRLIESLIALSIAYIAIENFMGTTLVHRWKITFLFGLVHGFGFSNVLREMELTRRTLAVSLFSFNIGIEAGQLVFVSLLFPLVLYLGRSRWKDRVMAGASVAIMSLGFYWFVQRSLFS
jgi:hypothetical protein